MTDVVTAVAVPGAVQEADGRDGGEAEEGEVEAPASAPCTRKRGPTHAHLGNADGGVHGDGDHHDDDDDSGGDGSAGCTTNDDDDARGRGARHNSSSHGDGTADDDEEDDNHQRPTTDQAGGRANCAAVAAIAATAVAVGAGPAAVAAVSRWALSPGPAAGSGSRDSDAGGSSPNVSDAAPDKKKRAKAFATSSTASVAGAAGAVGAGAAGAAGGGRGGEGGFWPIGCTQSERQRRARTNKFPRAVLDLVQKYGAGTDAIFISSRAKVFNHDHKCHKLVLSRAFVDECRKRRNKKKCVPQNQRRKGAQKKRKSSGNGSGANNGKIAKSEEGEQAAGLGPGPGGWCDFVPQDIVDVALNPDFAPYFNLTAAES